MNTPISDKDFYHLTSSINKALNPMESPLKMKHARSIIIMTHRTKEVNSFWTVILRQPLMEYRFTAWKFCHLFHKVLREGHENAIKQSYVFHESTRQCRLAPLITLIQDSNPLYDICVRIMFKLHNALPSDVLGGHRQRFSDLFFKLKNFYDNVRPLQYFADLIQVPHLPETAPNFTSKIDFGCYIPPVVLVQSDPEPVMENLLDVSQTKEPQNNYLDNDKINELESIVKDKETNIRKLHMDLLTNNKKMEELENKFAVEVSRLRNEIVLLQEELSFSKETNENMLKANVDMESKLDDFKVLSQKSSEEEEKVRVSEEKFQKLKIMYTQIRDEHINLLRQQSDISKALNKEKVNNRCLETEILRLNGQISCLKNEIQERNLVFDEKNELQIKLEETLTQCRLLEQNCDKIKNDLNEVKYQNFKEIEDLGTKLSNYEICKAKVNTLEKSLEGANAIQVGLKENLAQVKVTYEFKLETERSKNTALNKRFQEDICQKNNHIESLETEVTRSKNIIKDYECKLESALEKRSLIENEVESLTKKIGSMDVKLKIANEQIKKMEIDKEENETKCENLLKLLLRCIYKSTTDAFDSILKEPYQAAIEKSIKLIEHLYKILDNILIAWREYCQETFCIEGLVCESLHFGHVFSLLCEQCVCIYNTSTDIGKGQDVFNEINNICEPVHRLLDSYHIGNTDDVQKFHLAIKAQLYSLNLLLNELGSTNCTHIDLGDMVEKELEEMDKAIEEATIKFTEFLSNSRAKDEGIKLEVNEKILDACTNLLDFIKLLINKSKILQNEIVTSGSGNTTAKEFYKRNSQWTEGLISASKSVAKGANLLVDAANKAICNDSNQNFEIIVAAQEIAACTAQLVIASKVKAPQQSQKLTDLVKASRNVSKATGIVVATVKDCNLHLEQSQEIDVTKLTASQVKTMEMEMHVKVLELEQALQMQRLKLATFRKNNYQNAEN